MGQDTHTPPQLEEPTMADLRDMSVVERLVGADRITFYRLLPGDPS